MTNVHSDEEELRRSVLLRNAQGIQEERKRAEQALRENSEFVRVTLRGIADGVITSDMDGRVVFVNVAAERLTGWAHEDAQHREFSEVVRFVSDDKHLPLGGSVKSMLTADVLPKKINHALLVARDGLETAIEATVSPICDDEGQVFGVVLVMRDISERQSAELAREQLAAIVETSQDAIISKDTTGRILSWNAAAARMYGYTEAEAIGQSIMMLIPPELADEETSILRRLLRGERIDELETVRVSKSGRRIPVAITVSPILDGEGRVIGASKIARDIGPRLRAEQRARFVADASAIMSERAGDEQLLVRIAELAVESFADWCLIHLRTADGSCHRLQAARGARTAARADATMELPPEALVDVVMDVATHGKTEWNAEVTDRQAGIQSYVSSPLISRNGTLGVVTFVAADNGPRYDENDVAVAEELARRMAIALENASLLSALKEGDRRKDEFLAMLAHELRNPLAPIRNALHVLRLKSPPLPELQWARDIMDRQLDQLNRLVDDLLDVSRIATGKIELRKECVALDKVMQSALEASRPLIEAMKHDIVVSLPDHEVTLEADLVRLAQVLSNLLNNATKYTPPGGHIVFSAKVDGPDVIFTVRDDGVGISADMLPRIFDMFTQADRSNAQANGGLGIGLTLVRLLVKLHGGSVTALSGGLGTGSTFEVRLPMGSTVRDTTHRRPRTTREMLSGLPARRVLVVDDNRDAADSLAVLLEMAGSAVHTVYDGLDALDVVPTFRPDVILLDIGLPHLNGYEVSRRIRQEHGNAVSLVALTGWGQDEDRRRARDSGFNHHLTKPISLDALRAVLAEPPHGS